MSAQQPTSLQDAIAAHRSGKIVMEKLPSGARRRFNPSRRARRALMKKYGITTGRQWKRFRRRARVAAGKK